MYSSVYKGVFMCQTCLQASVYIIVWGVVVVVVVLLFLLCFSGCGSSCRRAHALGAHAPSKGEGVAVETRGSTEENPFCSSLSGLWPQ